MKVRWVELDLPKNEIEGVAQIAGSLAGVVVGLKDVFGWLRDVKKEDEEYEEAHDEVPKVPS